MINKMHTEDLPDSWQLVPLGEFVENEKGKKPKQESKEKSTEFNLPYIDIQAFEEGIIKSWTNGEGCRLCHEDDFLMVWDGSRSGLVGKGVNGALGSTLVRINFPGIFNDYAYYFLQSKFAEINSRAKGVGIPHVDPNLLWNYGFPIPPLNEQKRIVAKIEELFSELEIGTQSLKTAREQLKVYRQAVLKHAFEGKLTAPWREKNKIEFKQEKIKFIELCESSQNGLSKRSGNDGVMIPVIRLADITSEEIDLSDLREIRLSEGERTKYQLLPNDLLCIRVNGSPSLVGRLVLIKTDRDLAYCDHFIRFRINEKTTAKFIKYFFNTPQARRYIDLNKVSSAGQNTVSQKTIGDIEIPKFSIEEQTQIAMEIEARLSLVDKIEETIDTELQKSEALRQSILKKAFAGQLVAQNPADEPASLLLERIRTEKATPKPTAKKPKEKRRAA